jgi:hypothetical protein
MSRTVYADSGGLSLSGEDDGWAYTVKASPLPDKLNLDLDVSRKYNGLVVKVTGPVMCRISRRLPPSWSRTASSNTSTIRTRT